MSALNGWVTTTLGDQIRFQRGFDITRKEQSAGDVPVVSSGGIASFHGEAAADGPGVVIGRKGALGTVHYVEGPYWPHDTTLWVTEFRGNQPRFVYYFLKQVDVSWLNVGSASPTLNRNHLHPLKVRWPGRDVQIAIAEVLGALDDKIAANLTIAQNADALATALYADQARRHATLSERTFDDVADVRGGGTPSSKVAEYWDGEVMWATPTDVTGLKGPYLFDTARKITDEGLANCSSGLYPAGSILMTSRATIGAFALACQPTAVNQGFIVVIPRGDVPPTWLFHEMRSRVTEFTSMANGATFLELSRGNFKKFRVRLADASTMGSFEARASALHERAAAALKENGALAATRDSLLPGLMCGKLRVRDAERVLERLV